MQSFQLLLHLLFPSFYCVLFRAEGKAETETPGPGNGRDSSAENRSGAVTCYR